MTDLRAWIASAEGATARQTPIDRCARLARGDTDEVVLELAPVPATR